MTNQGKKMRDVQKLLEQAAVILNKNADDPALDGHVGNIIRDLLFLTTDLERIAAFLDKPTGQDADHDWSDIL